MKYSKTIKWAAAISCVCLNGLPGQVNAINLPLDQAAFLGELNSGGHGKHQQEQLINQLAGMTLNTTVTVDHKTYMRSGNAFDSLPPAGFETRVNRGESGIILNGAHDYLLARCGASATMIWYIGGLTGSYDFPAPYKRRGVTAHHHYSLFQSAGSGLQAETTKVPDSGSALGLLGLGVTSLGLFRQLGKSRSLRR